jgi:hypothetical protein
LCLCSTLFFFFFFSRLLLLSSAVSSCPLFIFPSGKSKGKGKCKTVHVLTQALYYEGIGDSRGMAPRILNLGFRWERVFGFTPRLLYPRYPPDRLGVPHRQSARCRTEEPFDPYENRTTLCRSRSPLPSDYTD